MSVDNLLSRLNKVRSHGKGQFMAQCPCHADKTASLSIKDMGDGRILINCFASCDTYSILQSVGLDWKDVLPESAISNREKSEKQVLYSSEVLKVLKFEAQIITLIGFDIKKTGVINGDAIERLELAMQRINKGMGLANV